MTSSLMRVSLEQPLQEWAQQYPLTVEAINRIHEAGGRIALAASRLAHAAGDAIGWPALREPDDTDLLIPAEDLPLAASALGVPVCRDEIKRVRTGDGYAITFKANEVVAHADSTIQIVTPKESLCAADHRYHTAFTGEAAADRQIYETNYGVVPVALRHSLFLYGILQRNNGKNDAHNTAVLHKALDGDVYHTDRAEAMGIDGRVWSFVQRAVVGGLRAFPTGRGNRLHLAKTSL